MASAINKLTLLLALFVLSSCGSIDGKSATDNIVTGMKGADSAKEKVVEVESSLSMVSKNTRALVKEVKEPKKSLIEREMDSVDDSRKKLLVVERILEEDVKKPLEDSEQKVATLENFIDDGMKVKIEWAFMFFLIAIPVLGVIGIKSKELFDEAIIGIIGCVLGMLTCLACTWLIQYKMPISIAIGVVFVGGSVWFLKRKHSAGKELIKLKNG